MSLEPAVAAVRLAVRRDLADVGDAPVLVACSGGADSLALLTATVFEGRTKGWHVVGVTVDHGLQDGSDEQAARVVGQMATLGADETVSVQVRVEARGQGPEAAAREARYAVLEEVAQRWEAAVVLLGHTRDDQAETVLLGLGRGSGPRSVAGMVARRGIWWRPLLGVRRATTRAACAALGLPVWDDPWNADPAYTRARLRAEVLPLMDDVLGGGVAPALARTAAMLREDLDALDALAADDLHALRADDGTLPARELAARPAALRRRVLRGWLLAAGVGDLQAVHLEAVDALVSRWHGQGSVDLPGRVAVVRASGSLALRPSGVRDGSRSRSPHPPPPAPRSHHRGAPPS
jgi:tRNA(Ile)-lysidine synthase